MKARPNVIVEHALPLSPAEPIVGSGVRVTYRKRGTHPRVFSAKSAESPEKKRVEFCVDAKKRKRVRKSMKRNKLEPGGKKLEEKIRMHPPTPPHYIDQYQKKILTKCAFRK